VIAIDRNANIVVAEVGGGARADGAVIDADKCYIGHARLLLIGPHAKSGGYTRTRDAFSMRQARLRRVAEHARQRSHAQRAMKPTILFEGQALAAEPYFRARDAGRWRAAAAWASAMATRWR
jgi:hypothetical protein